MEMEIDDLFYHRESVPLTPENAVFSPSKGGLISLELKKEEAESLMLYVDGCIAEDGCDHTTRFAEKWLNEHISPDRHEKIRAEIEDMGGYCDCEVVCNCYEEYDIALPEEE